MIEISFERDAAVLQLKALQKGIAEKAIVRALNRTAVTVRAEASRLIARELGSKDWPVNKVRAKLKFTKADRIRLQALVTAAKPSTMPAAMFITAANQRGRNAGPRTRRTFNAVYAQNAVGVRLRYRRKSFSIPGAWLAERYGREAVLIRASAFKAQVWPDINRRFGKGSRTYPATQPDFPIAEVRLPGIPMIFLEKSLVDTYRRVAAQRFAVVIAQEIKFLKGA